MVTPSDSTPSRVAPSYFTRSYNVTASFANHCSLLYSHSAVCSVRFAHYLDSDRRTFIMEIDVSLYSDTDEYKLYKSG